MGIGGGRTTGGSGWRVPSRPCDYCQRAAAAALFCRVDSAFLCHGCDGEIHRAKANKLASRQERVRLCEVCEQAPAAVTCRADAASLCSACDADIHSVNPLARRHHRLPVEPLLNDPSDTGSEPVLKSSSALRGGASPMSLLFPSLPNDAGVPGNPDVCEMVKPVDAFFIDPCFDLDLGNSDGLNGSGTDGQVPVQAKADSDPVDLPPEKCLHMDLGRPAKPASFRFPAHSFTQTVSSSSQDFGVVPDGSDVSNPYVSSMSGGLTETSHSKTQINIQATQLSGVDREARVLRYKEKRKNRKFEKTIRYASRKAYAETRPRIKGRFAKRSEVEGQLVDSIYGGCSSVFFADAEFGVVPTF
uniref:Zinc finger protein CONSTANS-LIKE 4 n=1 Tax=Lagerstroemia indica TaxID=141186 RepID=A0A068L7N2_9MYRT|nr:zinc finger protein CONSTANS-LIKE 4 [Lagerstroemia indica]